MSEISHQQTVIEVTDFGKPSSGVNARGRRCARCAAAFGRFYNTGAQCPGCRLKVCRQCREFKGPQGAASALWLCNVCHKIQDLRCVSADWRRSNSRDNYLSALDILKHSIRRAWTINGPPARWSAARKSAEFRLYRSLPNRRRDYLDEENSKNTKKPTESLIKPPKIIGKSFEKAKQNDAKRSSIPVFRNRSSREFEDIRSPHETSKRSLIPQRYRGSTDDLRRSREDISIPSFIPKLLSPRNKEDKLKRQDSKDDVHTSSAVAKFQAQQFSRETNFAKTPIRLYRRNSRDETIAANENSVVRTFSAPLPLVANEILWQECTIPKPSKPTAEEKEITKMVDSNVIDKSQQRKTLLEFENAEKIGTRDEIDEVPRILTPESLSIESRERCKNGEVLDDADVASIKESDKQKLTESALGKKDEPLVVRRKFSKEELSNDDTDDTYNRRCSSHFSPEASPLSTRSSKYSPRESESEPTPALPRKITSERGESSSASQRIRDAITRTRRESNSSAKYESSGSEGVRLSESGLSSYVDIARRVKLFSSGSIGPSAGSCDEILQRDSATSAGEDEHDDHSRLGPASQNRVMLRRRRQFDAQGPRRRSKQARTCCPDDHTEEEAAAAAAAAAAAGAPGLLDYRRLVFISSDSSSGREEDDADSSCSGSSYLNKQQQQSGSSSGCGLEDCDWDYFESNSLKLQPLLGVHQQQGQQSHGVQGDWSCCPARLSAIGTSAGCCQACGGSKNAKVLPVPVPIPVPVPYPVPVPASLWTGEFAASTSSMISRDAARLEQSLPLNLRGCDPSAGAWFSWNPRFDASSLLFSQSHIFPRELSSPSDSFLQPEKQEEKIEAEIKKPETIEPEKSESENKIKEEPIPKPQQEEQAEPEPPRQEQRMFRHVQEQDSRSSSGRSSADSSDLEDSAASHRFSRVLVVNDDSLTSDNDIEDNEDSDSARESHPITLKRISVLPEDEQDRIIEKEANQPPIVLRKIRTLNEDIIFNDNNSEKSEDEEEEEPEELKKCEIASYAEIYFASTQDTSDDVVLLKSVKSIDPEGSLDSLRLPAPPAPAVNRAVNDEEELEDDSSNDSAVMPDSLEVSMQELEDSIEEGRRRQGSVGEEEEEVEEEEGEREREEGESSAQLRRQFSAGEDAAAAAFMAKSRKKWQIPASFDIKGIPSTHFLPPERKKEPSHSLLTAALEDLQPEEEENANDEEEDTRPSLSLSQLNSINNNASQANNKYKSCVMITQGAYQPVNVIASDTTTVLQPRYFEQLDDTSRKNINQGQPSKKPIPCKRLLTNPELEVDSGLSVGSASESDDVQSVKNASKQPSRSPIHLANREEEPPPTPPTPPAPQESSFESKRGGPLILEEGLADDDSWVEEISHDEDDQSATTATEESSEDETGNNLGDREEELRGYHRQAIDFTLHTIVEESCEESEAETSASWRRRLVSASAPDLDKYFFFGLGADGNANNSSRELDSLSESSSIFSEGLDSLTREENASQNASQEKSSGMEKYFLAEFLGLDQDRRDSDGSVGSDSEGRPSPEAQRRKRLVRARGTGRSHSSLENLLALSHNSQNNSLQDGSPDAQESQSEGSSTETDGTDEINTATPLFGTDGQFDTVKRKKKKLRNLGAQSPRVSEDRSKTPEPKEPDTVPEEESNEAEEDDGRKTPQPEISESSPNDQDDSKQQSRDSGFVGSCDDLLLTPSRSVFAEEKTSESTNITQAKDKERDERNIHERLLEQNQRLRERLTTSGGSLSRKDSFNNWSSDEETNLMMSKMRQFFKTMVANSNSPSTVSPAPSPSPRFSKARTYQQNARTKPPQLVYFENELTRLMKTVPGIRDDQVREIVEYLSSEETWSDSYDSSDYTSSDLEGTGGRRSALQEQISQSCQQIISKFEQTSDQPVEQPLQQQNVGRDTAFVYQKLVQSFTKMAGDNVSDACSTPHSSPPLIAKVMHHIGSRLVALMHEVSESNSTHHSHGWRRYPHHRTPSSASTTEDDDSTSDSASAPSYLPRSKSHDPLLLINGHANGATSMPPAESEEREASDYERFSWRGSFESALMAADSRTKLSLLACSGGDVSATAMAAKRRSAGDLLFNPKSFSREQLDRVRSCGSIGGAGGGVTGGQVCGGSIEEKIWSNRRRSSVPDANTRGESGASAGDEDTEDEEDDLDYAQQAGDPRATTLPRGMQTNPSSIVSTTNSLPRQASSSTSSSTSKAQSAYHFLPQHSAVKSARYRPPGFTRNSPSATLAMGPKRAFSAPGLQVQGRARRQQSIAGQSSGSSANVTGSASISADEASLSEACSTPIIGASSRTSSSHASMDLEDIDRSLHAAHMATRASLSSLGARSDSMASVYSGAGEGRWCGSVAVRGEVEFSLQYDYKQLTFEVHVTQCRDLAPVDVKRNRSDPYVKVYLLPDKSKSGKRKTKVKKHTLNPVFDETLRFHTSLNSLETRTLWLTVWHSDMFGRNDFLGEVRMPLENKIFDDPRPQWYPLQERTEPFDDPVAYKGEVIVGLKFVPPDPSRQDRDRDESRLGRLKKNWNRGSLHVLVKEARNLQTRAKNSGTCDPFCKSYLLPDKGRSGKQKTGVVRRSTGSPVWNHTFVYKDVSIQELAERGLELTVWDHDRIASNEFLGGVRFNLGTGKHYGKAVDWMDATGREMSLWQSMLERPNFWVEGAVTLRPNLHNHGKTGTS